MEQFALSAPTERQLQVVAAEKVRALLPASWEAVVGPGRRPGESATLRVTAPDGRVVAFALGVKPRIEVRDVPSVARQLRESKESALVAARYLSPRAREALRAEGLSYVDATGNVDLSTDEPAIALRASGSDRDPWRPPDGQIGGLRGLPAARVVRALVDLPTPWRVRELAVAAGTSLGSTARAVELLDREALIERDRRGGIEDVAWDRLLERWALDYDLTRGRRVLRLFAPRGVEVVEDALRGVRRPYAVGGSLAARWQLPYAEPTTAIVYSDDIDALRRALGLMPAQTRANVLLIEPRDDLPLVRAQQIDAVAYTGPSQTVVDLINGPGRNPEEGRALLDWMRENASDWRAR